MNKKFACQTSTLGQVCIKKTIWSFKSDFCKNPLPKQILFGFFFASAKFCDGPLVWLVCDFHHIWLSLYSRCSRCFSCIHTCQKNEHKSSCCVCSLFALMFTRCLRGAWRDHCFPEPFSWFLHETGLESLKITSARCFLLKCQRKDSKKAKEYRQFRGVLRRWRTAPIDRTTFHACQRCRKTAVFAVFSRLRGVIWRGKAFREQQCQFLTRNKSLSSENESNSFDDFWVRAYRFDFAPRRRPRARSM